MFPAKNPCFQAEMSKEIGETTQNGIFSGDRKTRSHGLVVYTGKSCLVILTGPQEGKPVIGYL